MNLTRIRPGDIAVGNPTGFSIYSVHGKLLLKSGQLVASQSLLDQALRSGYRDSAEPYNENESATHESTLLFCRSASKVTPAESDNIEWSTSAALPNLAQRVEFFQLSLENSTEKLGVNLLGVVPEKALLVGRTLEGGPANLVPDTVYDATMFAGTRLFRFQTQLLPDSSAPFDCWFLAYPKGIAQAPVRRHWRVATSVPAKLQSGEYESPIADVTVVNISVTGAGIKAPQNFLAVGQYVSLAMNLRVDQRMRPVTVYATVRNRRTESSRVHYGLEFVRTADEVRRNLKDFVLEQMAHF
ncbi:PilZ domain-containing protein [Paraburkholderia adhaesiva]|uniref:PilZ domain-containing protein n=1 Tax=Paraburkholderia adhaesiva TaxID=2883244 RepID=UPI001F2651CD|nr:PilZ domain-containing protein [Paraburkholderia adhaesiva]